MAIAIALVLLVIGTVAFHLLNPWWFTPIASNWGLMDDTVNLTFWVTGAVFVAVNLFMAYAIVRYRNRKGREQRAEYQPESKKLEWWLTGLTTIGVAALLAPGLVVWAKFVTVPEEATVVEAIGQQWTWNFRLPGDDGALGTVDQSLISADNPFGIDANDPKGQDDVLVASPELHLPLDKPVKLLLRSNDVLHNLTVPQFRVKMDLVPGMVTFMWLTPTRTGRFEILCQEMCGLGHFVMRGAVVVDGPDDYQAWLGRQPTYSQVASRPAPDAVAGQDRVRNLHGLPRRQRRRQSRHERAETRRAARLVPRTPVAEFQARYPRRRARRRDCRTDARHRVDARRCSDRRGRRARRDAAGRTPAGHGARRHGARQGAVHDLRVLPRRKG